MLLDLSVLSGRVRGSSLPDYSEGDDKPPAINRRGELLIVQSLPPKAELARLGQTWTLRIRDTTSPFTYVNAWPTTRAELVLYNGDPTKSYILDSAWMVDVTSAAAAQSKTLLGQIGAPGIAAPTDDANQIITGRSGKTYNGNAKKAIANTAFALQDKWEILGVSNNVQAASIGAAVWADLYGAWIIPPGRAMCFAGLASTAAGTAIIGCTWHEAVLALG